MGILKVTAMSLIQQVLKLLRVTKIDQTNRRTMISEASPVLIASHTPNRTLKVAKRIKTKPFKSNSRQTLRV